MSNNQSMQDDQQQPNQKDDELEVDPNVDYSKVPAYNNDDKLPTQNQVNPILEQTDLFMTQQKSEEYLWKSFDFLFPAGKLAKLVKIHDYWQTTFPYSDILTKLKLDDGYPVLNFIGAMHNMNPKMKDSPRGKFYAGIARACFNTDAVIVDNAITSGIEKFALRRGLKVVGVAPEASIKFPKVNPTNIEPTELSNGHTHIFLLNNLQNLLKWGDEAEFKINLCKKIAEGKLSKTKGRPRCKIVNILFADTIDCFNEIRLAVISQLPIIVVRGSKLCDEYLNLLENTNSSPISDKEFEDIMSDKNAHFFPLNSLNSEEIAQCVHFLLTYTPYTKLDKLKFDN